MSLHSRFRRDGVIPANSQRTPRRVFTMSPSRCSMRWPTQSGQRLRRAPTILVPEQQPRPCATRGSRSTSPSRRPVAHSRTEKFLSAPCDEPAGPLQHTGPIPPRRDRRHDRRAVHAAVHQHGSGRARARAGARMVGQVEMFSQHRRRSMSAIRPSARGRARVALAGEASDGARPDSKLA